VDHILKEVCIAPDFETDEMGLPEEEDHSQVEIASVDHHQAIGLPRIAKLPRVADLRAIQQRVLIVGFVALLIIGYAILQVAKEISKVLSTIQQ